MVVELKYKCYYLSITSMLHQKLKIVNKGRIIVVCARVGGARAMTQKKRLPKNRQDGDFLLAPRGGRRSNLLEKC